MLQSAHFVDEGVALIMDGTGHFQHEELWKDLKRKKKREKIHEDYYQFKTNRVNNVLAIENEDDRIEGDDALEEDRLEDPDYLEKRKQKLKNTFSKKIKIE